MALTHTIHKEHTLGQSLVQKHVLHPEVQWKEEANFILGWKLTHVSGSKGGHALETQGAGTGLLPVGIGEVCSTSTATMTSWAQAQLRFPLLPFLNSVPGIGGLRDYAGTSPGAIQSVSVH